MVDIENYGKEFEGLATDMIPVIKDMDKVLRKHGIESLASLTVGADGYFMFSHTGTRWDFSRISYYENPRIRWNFSEEIEWRE